MAGFLGYLIVGALIVLGCVWVSQNVQFKPKNKRK